MLSEAVVAAGEDHDAVGEGSDRLSGVRREIRPEVEAHGVQDRVQAEAEAGGLIAHDRRGVIKGQRHIGRVHVFRELALAEGRLPLQERGHALRHRRLLRCFFLSGRPLLDAVADEGRADRRRRFRGFRRFRCALRRRRFPQRKTLAELLEGLDRLRRVLYDVQFFAQSRREPGKRQLEKQQPEKRAQRGDHSVTFHMLTPPFTRSIAVSGRKSCRSASEGAQAQKSGSPVGLPLFWCGGRDLNPHVYGWTQAPQACLSTCSSTPAFQARKLL